MQYQAYIDRYEADEPVKHVYIPDIPEVDGMLITAETMSDAFAIAHQRVYTALLERAVAGRAMPKRTYDHYSKNFYISRLLDFKDPTPRRAPIYFSLTEDLDKARERAGLPYGTEIYVEAIEISEESGFTFVHLVHRPGPNRRDVAVVGSSECGPKDTFDVMTGIRIALFRAVRSLAEVMRSN